MIFRATTQRLIFASLLAALLSVASPHNAHAQLSALITSKETFTARLTAMLGDATTYAEQGYCSQARMELRDVATLVKLYRPFVTIENSAAVTTASAQINTLCSNASNLEAVKTITQFANAALQDAAANRCEQAAGNLNSARSKMSSTQLNASDTANAQKAIEAAQKVYETRCAADATSMLEEIKKMAAGAVAKADEGNCVTAQSLVKTMKALPLQTLLRTESERSTATALVLQTDGDVTTRCAGATEKQIPTINTSAVQINASRALALAQSGDCTAAQTALANAKAGMVSTGGYNNESGAVMIQAMTAVQNCSAAAGTQ